MQSQMQKLLWQLPERFSLQTIAIIFYAIFKKSYLSLQTHLILIIVNLDCIVNESKI